MDVLTMKLDEAKAMIEIPAINGKSNKFVCMLSV
jgi:hypothetical protein